MKATQAEIEALKKEKQAIIDLLTPIFTVLNESGWNVCDMMIGRTDGTPSGELVRLDYNDVSKDEHWEMVIGSYSDTQIKI